MTSIINVCFQLCIFISGRHASIQASTVGVFSDCNPLDSPPRPTLAVFTSPVQSLNSQDKENNLPRVSYSKEKVASIIGKSKSRSKKGKRSPLKDIGNLSRRSLCFSSPKKKESSVVRPLRLVDSEPTQESSSPNELDADSRDSGYSESATKCEPERFVCIRISYHEMVYIANTRIWIDLNYLYVTSLLIIYAILNGLYLFNVLHFFSGLSITKDVHLEN